MAKDIIKSLKQLILPISDGWDVTDFDINDKTEEVHVTLSYLESDYKENGEVYSIYDYRPERKWRHLDLWQYKTYITASVPRIKTAQGVKSIAVPWAEDFDRITGLFEKK